MTEAAAIPMIIDRSELTDKVSALKHDGWRMVQVCATALADKYEVTYSFDKGEAILHLRVLVPQQDAVLPSITVEYFGAFTYENELQDLFGLRVEGLKLDFKGKFYQLAQKTPFAKAPKGS